VANLAFKAVNNTALKEQDTALKVQGMAHRP
jgi:hypothetical protein